MPAPSPLSIATSSLRRLVQEEQSYHRELLMQQAAIEKLEAGGSAAGEGPGEAEEEEVEERGNRAFRLRQEKRALDETKAVFPKLRERIEGARGDLEALLASFADAPDGNVDAEVVRAREVLGEAERALG